MKYQATGNAINAAINTSIKKLRESSKLASETVEIPQQRGLLKYFNSLLAAGEAFPTWSYFLQCGCNAAFVRAHDFRLDSKKS